MRCGYCHSEGHNQRTCPKLTAAYKVSHDRDIDNGETDSYSIQRYKARISPIGKKGNNQRCGYCGQLGHTRRTCKVMSQDKVTYEKHHNLALRVIYDYISDCPVGIGSLFSQKHEVWTDNGYEEETRSLVVVDFGISDSLLTHSFRPWLKMMEPISGKIVGKSLLPFVCNRGYRSHFNPVTLAVRQNQPVPSDWIEKRSVSIKSLKDHELFRRSGNKHEDKRDYSFGYLQELKESAGKRYFDEKLHQWTEEGMREELRVSHSDRI